MGLGKNRIWQKKCQTIGFYMQFQSEPYAGNPAIPGLTPVTNTTTERRRWARAQVRWQVQIFGTDARPLRCVTRDVSSGGFYVSSERKFEPGERLACTLSIPSYRSRQDDEVLVMRCRVEVVRVESGPAEKRFGTACRILEYQAGEGTQWPVGSH